MATPHWNEDSMTRPVEIDTRRERTIAFTPPSIDERRAVERFVAAQRAERQRRARSGQLVDWVILALFVAACGFLYLVQR